MNHKLISERMFYIVRNCTAWDMQTLEREIDALASIKPLLSTRVQCAIERVCNYARNKNKSGSDQ